MKEMIIGPDTVHMFECGKVTICFFLQVFTLVQLKNNKKKKLVYILFCVLYIGP